jgi:hypothetical protein
MNFGHEALLRDSQAIELDARSRAYETALSLARLVLFGLTIVACMPLHAQDAPAWPDTYVTRLQALALLQTLNAEVLASRSATRTLEDCAATIVLRKSQQLSRR